jgi:hypothetical protein
MRMVSPRTLHQTSRRVIVRPFVRFAARFLGPGPLRLQMVKLAHELDEGDNYFEGPAAGTRRRAA